MGKTELLIGLRKKNGQIGYLSEGLNIPEFFELITPKVSSVSILPDFSPVINELHSIHSKYRDESLTAKYNSIVNFWSDANTYSICEVKLQKNVQLAHLANEVINDIQLRIQNKTREVWSARRTDEIQKIVNSITPDCNMYIDTLLCFIHSKASLEISSFKKDTLLMQYCDFLYDSVFSLYRRATNYDDFNSSYSESLLCYLAFDRPKDIDGYLVLHPELGDINNVKMRFLNDCKSTSEHRERLGYHQSVSINYKQYDNHDFNLCESIKSILYKINSVKKLLIILKNDDVEWNDSSSLKQEIVEFIKPTK
ncbi:hypothetical protein ACQKP8_26730 [Photobacterium alginatilyticum]|uniref:hypothetical protein n=1 Tax=Photobacterium alginatilyticum TaxID=1775171 RepID=UPI0040687572